MLRTAFHISMMKIKISCIVLNWEKKSMKWFVTNKMIMNGMPDLGVCARRFWFISPDLESSQDSDMWPCGIFQNSSISLSKAGFSAYHGQPPSPLTHTRTHTCTHTHIHTHANALTVKCMFNLAAGIFPPWEVLTDECQEAMTCLGLLHFTQPH